MSTKMIAVLGLALAAAGCSNGGGGSNGSAASVAPATSATAPVVPMAVTLATRSTTVNVGDTVEVALTASQVQNLYGAGADLSYDPALLDFQAVSDGGLIQGVTTGGGLRGGAPGVVTVAASAEGASSGATGSGDVVIVKFKAKAKGLVEVRPVDLVLEDAAGNQGQAAPGSVMIAIN